MKNITLTPSNNKNGTYGLCNLENNLLFYKDNIKYSDNLDNINELYFNCSPVILIDKKSKTSDDLIRIIYISQYDDIIKNIKKYYKNIS